MKVTTTILCLLATAMAVNGADLGTLKPGARPAVAAQGRELPRKAALPAKAPGKANFYVLSSDNSGTRLSSFTAG